MMITKFLTPVSIILANLYRFKKFGENNIMWNSPWKRKETERKIKICQGLQKGQGQNIIFSQIRCFVKECISISLQGR